MNSITETTNIYVLIDPRDNRIRYVGKANNVEVRLRNHVKEARQGKTDHKANWLRQVLKDGYYPILEIVEVCSINEWQYREIFWIEEMKRRGNYLTNEKEGGFGCNPSIETRERMSIAAKNRPSPNKGKRTPEDVKKKQSISAKRRWANMTEEFRKSYIEKLTNYKHKPISEETREKFREIGRNRVYTKEDNLRNSLRQRSLSKQQVAEIHSMLDSGVKQYIIANKFHVSNATISGIKTGKSYAKWDE